MPAKPFFDTNVIVYAFTSDDPRSEEAYALMQAGGVISVQVLNELVNVWRRKQGRGWAEVQNGLRVVKTLLDPPAALTVEVHDAAVVIARDHGFSIYDSLIVASALRAGCATLYSEDLQHSQTIERMTIRNPFADLASR
jgi:predicted nucleic acid-binding protein